MSNLLTLMGNRFCLTRRTQGGQWLHLTPPTKTNQKNQQKRKPMRISSFICGAGVVVALIASAQFASADEVDVDLSCGFTSTGIRVGGVGEYDCADGYVSENGGGTITVQVDLPAGTFDISGTPGPGDMYGPPAAVEVNGGNSTGIVGPTTVYVLFLNQGAAITRAAGISISGSLPDSSPVQDDVDLSCGFTSTGIRAAAVGEYDCADGYVSENGGGTITVQVDLPAGTFDISGTPGPGDMYGPPAAVEVNGGNSTGIVGPTTVYVLFLNQGAAITRAAGISINNY